MNEPLRALAACYLAALALLPRKYARVALLRVIVAEWEREDGSGVIVDAALRWLAIRGRE